LLSRRDAMTEEARVEASVKIAERAVKELDGLAAGQIVGLYAAKGSEVETREIDRAAHERGLVVVYPRVVEGTRELEFCIAKNDDLVVARFGLREPAAFERTVKIEEISLFYVPGVAFDRAGGRLGWGRGHYDATLAKAKADARRIGIAFECQITEHIDREAHDAPMHVIVTEVATHVV
jgi:5-formyltetrahydrofolate cyclo-ligase